MPIATNTSCWFTTYIRVGLQHTYRVGLQHTYRVGLQLF